MDPQKIKAVLDWPRPKSRAVAAVRAAQLNSAGAACARHAPPLLRLAPGPDFLPCPPPDPVRQHLDGRQSQAHTSSSTGLRLVHWPLF
ncbi:hypothetical protein AAFF_G00395240 [Aldrovandia affinis]|uniref:Uncharacterized protein n=1 Tax=Aldrovandia affinis TaxID=143900 RepID=A0AAD7R445_9TELE|nr:hypothetical protein AAFF_G00395240 [Aldrovandia affinis]